LVECQLLTDGWTNEQTDIQGHSVHRASVASRDKK